MTYTFSDVLERYISKYSPPIHNYSSLNIITTNLIFITIIVSLYTVLPISENIWTILTSIVSLIASTALFIVAKNKQLNSINALNNENKMLKLAINKSAKFCTIINNKGDLLYSDKEFNACLNPDNKHQNIENLIDAHKTNVDTQVFIKNMTSSNEHIETDSTFYINEQQLELTLKSTALTLLNTGKSNKQELFLLQVIPQNKDKFYKELLEKHDICMFTVNKDGQTVYINNPLLDIIETQDNKVQMINITEIIPGYNKECSTIYTKIPKPGNICIDTKISSHYNNQDKLYYSIVSINNEKLQHQVKNFKDTLEDSLWNKVFEESDIGALLLDNDHKIIKCNRSFSELCSPTINNTILEIIEQDKEEQLLLHLSSRETFNIELKLMNHENVKLYFTPINDDNISYIVYTTSTNDKRSLEEQFTQSQKMQAIGQLAGGIAHDFNNLLTAIIGFCDLLLMRHIVGDPSFADIVQIKQNANRAVNLVRQLLAFSRKQTLQPKIIDLTDIISELSSLVRRLIGESINLNIEYAPDLWNIKVDKGQLEQVIINIIVNARDAMDNSGDLSLSTQNILIDKDGFMPDSQLSTPDTSKIIPGEYVLISITDTGCGIKPQQMDKIFNPFFSTKETGTGLGLSTVYGIIKQSGGRIYIKSKTEEGTTFYILFSRSFNKADSLQEEDGSHCSEQDLTGNNTVLLVEDETAVRLCSTSALINKGYRVIATESTEEASKIFNNPDEYGKIDILVADVVMPNKSGTQIAKEFLIKDPNLKVILTSGYGEEIFTRDYGDKRDFVFLPKPFTLNQLAEKVKHQSQCQRQEQELLKSS